MATGALKDVVDLLVRDSALGPSALQHWYADRASGTPAARAHALSEVCAELDRPSHALSATLALVGGALVETGIDAEPLAHAVVGPLKRSLDTAAQLVGVTAAMPDESDTGDAIELCVGERQFGRATVGTLAREHAEALEAFTALERWYMPVVASWSRAPHVLRELQADASLRVAVERLAGACEAARWIDTLLKVLFDAPLVVLVPELGAGARMRISGCASHGQLMILLSDALHQLLLELGASGRAPHEVLRNARGYGPQEVEGCYGASFQLFPWQAFDPETGLPAQGRYRWTAPYGSGDMSLPADFLPGDIVPIDETRALLLVGPRAEGIWQFTRELAAARTFAGLRASVDDVERLSREEVVQWTERIVAHLPGM